MLVAFRPCNSKDLRTVLQMIRALYRYDRIAFDAKRLAPAVRKLLRNESLGQAWLLEAGKTTVGYAILTYNYDLEYGGLEGMLTDLFVLKKYRGKGVGSLALHEIEDFCRERRIDALELQVRRANVSAQTFYRKAGYKPLNRVVMVRDIPPEKAD